MRLGALAIFMSVTLGTAAIAQNQASRDPISGTWGMEQRPLLHLKLQPNGVVDGTIALGRPDNLGKITAGSCDGKTGVLALEGDARDANSGAPVKFRIEGKLEGEVLTVRAVFNGDTTEAKPLRRLPAKTAAK